MRGFYGFTVHCEYSGSTILWKYYILEGYKNENLYFRTQQSGYNLWSSVQDSSVGSNSKVFFVLSFGSFLGCRVFGLEVMPSGASDCCCRSWRPVGATVMSVKALRKTRAEMSPPGQGWEQGSHIRSSLCTVFLWPSRPVLSGRLILFWHCFCEKLKYPL